MKKLVITVTALFIALFATVANANPQEMGNWYVPYSFLADGPVKNGVQVSYVPLFRTEIPTNNIEYMRTLPDSTKMYFICGATAVSQDGSQAMFWLQLEYDGGIGRVAILKDCTTGEYQALGGFARPVFSQSDRYLPNSAFKTFNTGGDLFTFDNPDFSIQLVGFLGEEMKAARNYGKLYNISPGTLATPEP